MSIFGKKKCLVCETRLKKPSAEIRYKYLGDDGQEAIGIAYLCEKCSDDMESGNEEVQDD